MVRGVSKRRLPNVDRSLHALRHREGMGKTGTRTAGGASTRFVLLAHNQALKVLALATVCPADGFARALQLLQFPVVAAGLDLRKFLSFIREIRVCDHG
jgi:hypothetical protein